MRRKVATFPETTWTGCYDDSWKGIIMPESFAHPAKMARGLLCRILDHMLAKGYIQRGQTVIDPFGGIGTTAIEGASRGLRVVCCELEPRFVEMAKANVELHRRKWEAFGDPLPVILQGDSRRLAQVIAEAGLTSCPGVVGYKNGSTNPQYIGGSLDGTILGPEAIAAGNCEASRGIGTDNSTPNEPVQNQGQGLPRGRKSKLQGRKKGRNQRVQETQETSVREVRRDEDAGDSPQERRPLRQPPREPGDALQLLPYERDEAEVVGGEKSWTIPAEVKRPDRVDSQTPVCILSSPPFSESLSRGTLSPEMLAEMRSRGHKPSASGQSACYGSSPGQLGQMKEGALISSPPYEESPVPNASNVQSQKCPDAQPAREATAGYSVVSSPPFMDAQEGGGINKSKVVAQKNGRVHKLGNDGYNADMQGKSEGQLGNDQGDTFWASARLIVEQCHAILPPGAYTAWVTKDFVRDKQRVPFSDQWRQLCVSSGFEMVEWIKASLVKASVHNTLFDGQVTHEKQRKSFFRRLAEKKGSPRIDHEDVLILRHL